MHVIHRWSVYVRKYIYTNTYIFMLNTIVDFQLSRLSWWYIPCSAWTLLNCSPVKWLEIRRSFLHSFVDWMDCSYYFMYICIYIYTYICMYVCMHSFMYWMAQSTNSSIVSRPRCCWQSISFEMFLEKMFYDKASILACLEQICFLTRSSISAFL
jgi:hypothetical protein